MPETTLVPATPDLARDIARVHVRAWRAAYAEILDPAFLERLAVDERAARWQEILLKDDSQTCVASRNRETAGFVSFGRCRDGGTGPNPGEVWALNVDPDAWGLGVGRALLTHAVHALRTAAHADIFVWALSGNRRGIAFYQRCGFVPMDGSARIFELGGRRVEEICLRLEAAA